MSTHYFKSNILLASFLVLTLSINAQQTSSQYTTSDQKNGKERVITDKGDKTYQLEFTDGKMTFFSVDGVSIPEEKWGDYKAIINEIQEQMKKDKEQARLDRIQAEKDREQAKLDRIQADKDRERGKLDRIQADKDREQSKLDRIQADKDKDRGRLDRIQAEKDREQGRLDRIEADKNREQADRDRLQAEKDRTQAESDRQRSMEDKQQADKDRAQAALDRIQADKDREQAARDRVQAEKDRAQAAADKKMLADLTADLVSDKLIAKADDLHMLTISPTEMTVNGIKQPDAVHKKYQDKYSRFAKSNFAYMSDGSGKHIQMHRGN